jgi:pimeloyl-ACP methyl ester carboxylesterase
MISEIPEIRWARTVDGACIAYQDIGAGPVTLVVTHGWVSHLEIYWEQPRYVRFLRRLSRNMRVLVFDKRGIGMSDRVNGTPDIGTLADDVRAVMDAAGVEKAALLGWGGPGPELPVFFAATHPERTLCLTCYGSLRRRKGADYPWGMTEQELEESLASLLSSWGTLKGAREFARRGYGYLHEEPPEVPYTEPEFIAWNAKLARFAATPASYEAFERM